MNRSRFIDTPRYSHVAIGFHWLLALMIIGAWSFGFYMTDLPFSPARLKQYNWHKWAGITILTLSALRLLWRLTHRPPPLPGHTPAWQATASHATHWLLYAVFFALPLAGWAYSSAAGFPVVYFGVLQLPDFVPRDKELAEWLKLAHRTLAYTLAALVALHVAAALKHQWFDRDHLLARMNPFAK
ncbi:MAG: cytochrome b [Burkholderiaceae bacterium]